MSAESFGKIGRAYRISASDSDHGSTCIGRRVVLRRLFDGAILISSLANAYYARELLQLEITKDEKQEAFDLLDGLIGTNGENVSIGTVPAVNHPNVRKVKNYFSRSGEEVSTSYALALKGTKHVVREAAGAIRLREEDTAVVIGSRLANTYAEHHLGSAYISPDASYMIRGGRGERARPKWTFYSDSSVPPVEVVQWSKSWLSKNNLFVECKNGQTYSAPERLHLASGKKYREGDYLLISVVPKFRASDPQRVVIFEGLHRNGTRAAGLMCSKPPIQDLRIVARKVGANPYYQALFKIQTRVDANGETHPVDLKLCDDPFPLRFR
jgi:hypothetical protein